MDITERIAKTLKCTRPQAIKTCKHMVEVAHFDFFNASAFAFKFQATKSFDTLAGKGEFSK